MQDLKANETHSWLQLCVEVDMGDHKQGSLNHKYKSKKLST